ncbi:MAG: ribulose-phosphate 3-epimerase [Phycisphaerae bacterium]
MKLPPAITVEIAPSVLSADFSRLADEVKDVERAGARIIHLDIMDGHFVPNITFGPPVIRSLRSACDLCYDAHLMISQPQRYIEDFAKAGTDNITFHIESEGDPFDTIKIIRSFGLSAGVCIKPKTAVADVLKVAEMCDMVLVMTVEPGFGGQSFMADCAKKCAQLRSELGDKIRIQVDGGISDKTAAIVTGFGADTLVAGSAIFGCRDRAAAINSILAAARGAN